MLYSCKSYHDLTDAWMVWSLEKWFYTRCIRLGLKLFLCAKEGRRAQLTTSFTNLEEKSYLMNLRWGHPWTIWLSVKWSASTLLYKADFLQSLTAHMILQVKAVLCNLNVFLSVELLTVLSGEKVLSCRWQNKSVEGLSLENQRRKRKRCSNLCLIILGL